MGWRNLVTLLIKQRKYIYIYIYRILVRERERGVRFCYMDKVRESMKRDIRSSGGMVLTDDS